MPQKYKHRGQMPVPPTAKNADYGYSGGSCSDDQPGRHKNAHRGDFALTTSSLTGGVSSELHCEATKT